MADAKYKVKVGGAEYVVTAPDANTAWQWANMTHAQQAAPATPVAAPAAPAGTPEAPPLKEVKPAGLFDYITDREQAIKQDREYRAYLQDRMQRAETEDLKTQTGFFDRLGDFFSSGLLSARSGIKDVEAAIETDPALKKQFTQEARRFAADAGMEIKGGTSWDDVKEDYYKVLPFLLEQGAQSLPEMIASTNPLGAIGVGIGAEYGRQGRDVAELQGREDVTAGDLARVAPTATAVGLLNILGLEGILAAPAKTALGRVGKAALIEGGTEAAQGALQYLGPRLAAGADIDANDLFENMASSLVAGAGLGAGLRGTAETVAAPFRAKKEQEEKAKTEKELATSLEVQNEYTRLLEGEIAAVMEANPDLTQRQAFDQAKKKAEPLYRRAIENVIMATGGADESAGVGAGLDVSGGLEPSVPDAGELGGAAGDTGAVGEAVAGRVGEPDLGVPVSDVGQAEQPGALAPAEAAPKPAFDTTPIFEASTLKDRKSAAMQVTSDIVQEVPELQGLSKNKYNQAATQMANAAAKGTQFDPLDVLYKVAGIEPAAAAAPEAVAPKGPLIPEGNAPLETFSGETVLQHGRADEQVGGPLEGFTPAGEVAPEQRYGVEGVDLGGVFGAEGVYLASDPKWFTDMSGMYTPDIYDVSAPLENALVLTPDNIGSLPKKDTPWKGKEIADWAKSQGYDGIVVEGFDDLLAKLGAAQQPIDAEGGRAFKRSDFPQEAALSDLDAASRGIQPDPNYVGELDVFSGYLRSKNVDPEVGQDQVFAFNPEKMKVLGKAKGPAERVSLRSAAPPSGEPGPKKQPEVVSGGKKVTLTEAQRREAINKAEAKVRKLNRIQKRIASTNKVDEILSAQVDLAKLARGDKENIALLRGTLDTLDAIKWRTILPALSTEDIFRMLKDRIPALNEVDRMIRQDITRFETKEYLKLAEELEQIATFLKKFPKAAQALSDLQFASVAYQVDPTKAKTAEEYANKFDKKTKELKDALANTIAGDTKTQNSLNTKIKNRLDEIRSVYEGATTEDGRVYGFNDLGRPELGANRGKEIFKLIRDGHRRDLEASYNALRSRLMETKQGDALAEALQKLEKQFKPAMDQTIYFPAMRFGSFYARVGTGENSIFKMFETENERNKFVRLMEARGEEISETGNTEDLRNNFEKTAGGPLKEVLDLFEGNPKDMGALRGQVFDLWLQTMSTGDMRKHMAPRKMRAGYSTDILKNYASFRRSSINGVKRATYGYKLQNSIEAAKASVEKQPDEPKLQAFIEEIRLRALNDLTPPARDDTFFKKFVTLGNKAAFYQYLANPKTALIQLTQLHIVALPMLSQKYGTAEATMALSKYGFSSLGGLVVSPLKAVKREDGGFTFDWEQPNLLDNPISTLTKESDPELYELLSEGWQEGRDLNLYMDTFANQLGGYGSLDPQQRNALQELMAGRPLTAAMRGTVFTFEAMGALMHQMERVNREATYMAALELDYRKGRKAGKSHDVAKKEAIDAAVETTLAATFDFSAYNKPRILTSDVGRLAGQFMTYPYMMSSLLVRNMYTAIKFGPLEPGERLAAAQTAAGALLNIGLYAGLTGLPLYGLAKVIGSMLAWAFDDDDEEGGLSYIDEDGNIKATYDIDWWVRNVFIPRHFGADGTVANLFGLDDDTAEMLARAVEKGPISAITDIDLANSVALDFMFFLPEAPRAEKPEQQVTETVFNVLTGAAGGTFMDYLKAGNDALNGYTLRALEKMPKLYGNAAKAMRFSEEGQRTYQGELLGMDKDFWTNDKAILLSLGFNSTEAGVRQKQYYDAKKIDKKIEAERNDVLSQWRKLFVDMELKGYTPELEAERDRLIELRDNYNEEFPTHPIGPDTLIEVQANTLNKMRTSEVTRGVPIDKKSPYLQEMLLRRLNAEEAKEQ